MTETDTFTPRDMSPLRAQSNTIYRDTPQALPARTITGPLRSSVRELTQPTEFASDGILLGLAVLMIPVLVYSFEQMGRLASSGSLEQAIHAFLP